jgi:hypothetical protein
MKRAARRVRLAEATTILVALLLVGMPATADEPAVAQLVERVRAEYVALAEAERDFGERRKRGELSDAEAIDYAAYIDRLRDRVARGCDALERSGIDPLPPGLPCAKLTASMPSAAPTDPSTARTQAERTAALDAELDTALGEFDERLLREQERVKAGTPPSSQGQETDAEVGRGGGSQAGGQGGEAGEAGAGQPQTGGDDGEAESDDAQAGDDDTGDGRQGASGREDGQGGLGTPNQSGAPGTPDDVPDGSDDDVVARQIREAAEKETDPALKEKLWEEYRRYKRGTS